MESENVVLKKSMELSVEIVRFSAELNSMGRKVIADQILRSGTSIGANIWEAQDAESKKDFIHKIKLASKEASETHYWLELCNKLDCNEKLKNLIFRVIELKKIMARIVITSKGD